VRGVPAGHYIDPAVGLLEHSAVFARAWQLVCHVSDLPAPGTAARLDVAGLSAFVLRTRSGDLKAFRNACRHRGARLVEGDLGTGLAFCVDSRVRCPYHGWTYDETGALESIPAGQSFESLETRDQALEGLPVVQWHGLVFVANGTPDADLSEVLREADVDWPDATTMRRLAEPQRHVVAADWKLACEHLLDTAHWATARPALKPRVFEEQDFARVGGDAVRARGVPASTAKMPWPALAYSGLLARRPPAHSDVLFLWPNLLMRSTPEGLAVTQVLPQGTGSCVIRRFRYGVPDGSRETRLLRYLHERVARRAFADDARLLERCQQGLASVDARHTAAIGATESGLRWFAQRYAEAMAGVASRPVVKRRARRRDTPAAEA
jgi:carnitine monooxygenase subunit